MKKGVLLIVLFATVVECLGQRPGGRPGGRDGGASEIPVTGIVLDQESGAPLEFATVSIFYKGDSTLKSGGVTDIEGRFSFGMKPGPSYAVIEYISYAPYTMDIVIDREKLRAERKINLGTIGISPTGIQLEDVTIRAEKSETQFSLDKRVFNVGKDLANQGGSAQDILDNIPSVTVDLEGAVSLRGSQGVRILVDGKPSGLANQDNANGLRSIPANLIKSIEVVTNPSARYEAEGMAGIINIILKKDKGSGFNGSFDATIGAPLQAGLGANVNYRKGNVNWFANYGINQRSNVGGGYSLQSSSTSVGQAYQYIDQDRDRRGLNNSIRFGIDYIPTDKITLTGAFLYRTGDEDNEATLTYTDYLDSYPNNLIRNTVRTDDEREDEANLEYSLNYRQEFSSRKHTLDITAQFQDNTETEGSNFLEQVTFGDAEPDLIQRSNNAEGNQQWLFQLDFKKPVFNGDGNIELGARSSFRNIDNDYKVEEQQDGGFVTLAGLSNQFFYDEKVHALYSQLGQEFGKVGFQLGLRVEYSDVVTELLETGEVNARDYFNVFPSAFFNYKITDANSIQANYSSRIRRPRFWDLNPFFTFSDSRNTFSGNPNLDPEFTDSYELNFISYWDNLTISTGVFYRYSTDVIQRVLTFNSDGTTNRQPENIGIGKDLGGELTIQYSGLDWLRLNADFNVYNQQITVEDIDGLNNTDNLTYTTRLTPRIKMWGDSDLQLRLNYRGPRDTPQGFSRSITSLDLGWSKDLLQKRATITLSVRDVFNSRKRRSTTIGKNFYREGEFQWRGRTANLAFNYRINQKKKRSGSHGYGGGGEGEY